MKFPEFTNEPVKMKSINKFLVNMAILISILVAPILDHILKRKFKIILPNLFIF